MKRNTISALLAVLLLTGALASCGSSDVTETPNTPTRLRPILPQQLPKLQNPNGSPSFPKRISAVTNSHSSTATNPNG